MKTVISLFLFTSLLFASCGNSPSDKKEKSTNASEQPSEESASSSDLKKANSCDEYLDQYEKWTDDYFKLVDKYMKNPMDASLSEDFMKMVQEGSLWLERWSSDLVDCASKEKYQKRFDEISEKVEKKLEELGIE